MNSFNHKPVIDGMWVPNYRSIFNYKPDEEIFKFFKSVFEV